MVLEFHYHPSSPPSKAVWMLLEEMGIEYKAHVVDLMAGAQYGADYTAINPFSQVPTIVEGDFKLWESRAILRYLACAYRGKSPNMYPADLKQSAAVDRVLYADACAYETKIVPYLNIGGIFSAKEIRDETKLEGVKSALKMYNTYLDGKQFMAGDNLTVADLSCFNSMYVLSYADFTDFKDYPNISAWFENCVKNLKSFETCIQQPKDVMKQMYKEKLLENQGQKKQ